MPKTTVPKETIVAGHQRRVAARRHAAGVVELLLSDVPMQAIIDERVVDAVLEGTEAAEAERALPAIPVGIVTAERAYRPPRSVRAEKRRLKKKKQR
jgi:hypothetical protein